LFGFPVWNRLSVHEEVAGTHDARRMADSSLRYWPSPRDCVRVVVRYTGSESSTADGRECSMDINAAHPGKRGEKRGNENALVARQAEHRVEHTGRSELSPALISFGYTNVHL
jgi:hypothetical protein